LQITPEEEKWQQELKRREKALIDLAFRQQESAAAIRKTLIFSNRLQILNRLSLARKKMRIKRNQSRARRLEKRFQEALRAENEYQVTYHKNRELDYYSTRVYPEMSLIERYLSLGQIKPKIDERLF